MHYIPNSCKYNMIIELDNFQGHVSSDFVIDPAAHSLILNGLRLLAN